eukprot:1724332-Amphidinium_carterae.1
MGVCAAIQRRQAMANHPALDGILEDGLSYYRSCKQKCGACFALEGIDGLRVHDCLICWTASAASSDEEWDAPVLLHLTDVTCVQRDRTDRRKGFRLEFEFAENEFFTNRALWKEYISELLHRAEEHSPYTGALDVSEVQASAIQWNEGKDLKLAHISSRVCRAAPWSRVCRAVPWSR